MGSGGGGRSRRAGGGTGGLRMCASRCRLVRWMDGGEVGGGEVGGGEVGGGEVDGGEVDGGVNGGKHGRWETCGTGGGNGRRRRAAGGTGVGTTRGTICAPCDAPPRTGTMGTHSFGAGGSPRSAGAVPGADRAGERISPAAVSHAPPPHPPIPPSPGQVVTVASCMLA